MQAYAVVKADDVVSDISYRLTVIGVITVPNALDLDIQKQSLLVSVSQFQIWNYDIVLVCRPGTSLSLPFPEPVQITG